MGTSASQYTCGYRVLDVQPGSPGLQAGLVSFFDFIMKAEEETFETEGEALVKVLSRYKNRKLALVVYNTKSRTYREVSIVPSDTWGGDGLLGITIRHDSYQTSDNCLRVLEVVPGSPAASAGLIAESDYILGTAATTFADASELFEVVLDHVDRSLDIYVYNSVTDRVSLKTLRPNHNWGGEGCLGLDVGQGYLHALPTESRKTNGVACSLTRTVPSTSATARAPAASATASTVATPAPAPVASHTRVVDPLTAPAVSVQQATSSRTPESKVSRRKAAAAAAAAAAGTGTAAGAGAATTAAAPAPAAAPAIPAPATAGTRVDDASDANSSTTHQPSAAPARATANTSADAGPVTPARLPLAATISPRESKRTAGSKTPK